MYYGSTSIPAGHLYIDDCVIATKKVPESYTVEYPAVSGQVSFYNGFEEGNFSVWNGTNSKNATVSITSSVVFSGSYSMRISVDGSDDSYGRVKRKFLGTSEVYEATHVRFPELPDSNNTRLMFLNVQKYGGKYIASVGVYRLNNNYYWSVHITGDPANPPSNYTKSTIDVDTWYRLEFYLNATANGKAILWVNGMLRCEVTGDFSSYAPITESLPYLYVKGTQASSKTVFHDNFAADIEKLHSRSNRACAIDVAAKPNVVTKNGGTSQITVQLRDAEDQAVAQSGMIITIGISFWEHPLMKPILTYEEQSGYFVTVTTDSNGQAVINLIAQGRKGSVGVTAMASGLGSSSTVVEVIG